MAAPVDAHAGLARWFADFWLLPDLFATTESGIGPPDAWATLLAEQDFTTEHIENRGLPTDSDLPTRMAEDAWRTAAWLNLIGAEGLTAAGQTVADIAKIKVALLKPSKQKAATDDVVGRPNEAAWRPAEDVLATAVMEHYRAPDGRPVMEFVYAGADAIWDAQEKAWIHPLCPGLLLAEIETLLHLAFADPERASQVARNLSQHRRAAMSGVGWPSRRQTSLVSTLVHADAVSRYCVNMLDGYSDAKRPTITAVQATCILMVFCNLLEVAHPAAAVQCLMRRYG